MKKIFLFIALFSVLPVASFAADNTLADCAQATVQDAITAAASGDNIICPAGEWTYNTGVEITKNVTLTGNGIGSTIIYDNVAPSDSTNMLGGAFNSVKTNAGQFTITGFTIAGARTHGYGLITINNGKGWRIYGNQFQLRGTGGSGSGEENSVGIYIDHKKSGTYPDGLIDNNTFVDRTGFTCPHAHVYLRGDGTNTSTASLLPSQITTGDNTIFIEGNTFTNAAVCGSHQVHVVTSSAGGIFVFRHNTVTNGQIDAHGFSGTDGTREYQITNNAFTNSVSGLARWMFIRGGTGVVANNTMSPSDYNFSTNAIDLTDYRVNGIGSGSNWARRLGEFGNECCATNEGYPCTGQIGRGQTTSTGAAGWPESLDPLYLWGNTGDNAAIRAMSVDNACGSAITDYLQAGRDYYLAEKAGFTEYTYPHPMAGAGVPDTIPDNFSFSNQTGVALGSTNNTDNVTLTGFDNTTTLVLTGDASCKYSINGAAWATANDNVSVNDNVALRATSSGSYSTAVSCTLNLGGVSDTWNVTTAAAVEIPTAPRMRCGSMTGGWR